MAVAVLDAGVLIAVLDRRDPHHEAALGSIRRCLDRREELVVPASAYAELLVAPAGRGEQAVAVVEELLDRLPTRVHSATRPIARTAAGLRARYGTRLRLPDALVVATAIELRADRLLTIDRGWPEIQVAVEVVGPGTSRWRDPSSRGNDPG